MLYLNELNQKREHAAATKIQNFWRQFRRKKNLRKVFDRMKFVLKRSTSVIEVAKQRNLAIGARKVVSQPDLSPMKEVFSDKKCSMMSLSSVDVHFEKYAFCQSSKCELNAHDVYVFYANPSSTVISRRDHTVLHLSIANAI